MPVGDLTLYVMHHSRACYLWIATIHINMFIHQLKQRNN